jgi:3-deoxy-manno-octulosonate cytidylyltransferase (CMP-KDO synthetase)
MPVLGVIPARLGSTRLARKPLQLLGGEPLVVRVLARAHALAVTDEVVVATDAPEVQAVVERAGGRAIITASTHDTGTERVAEVARRSEFARFDVVVNLQGDEPFLPREAALGALDRITMGDDVGTAAVPLPAAEAGDPARVKVVLDERGRALYFSRALIPFPRDPDEVAAEYWQHLGIYAYTRPALMRWVASPPCALERTERLEQLRALHLGLEIGVATLERTALPGIDTPADLARAEAAWHTLAMGEGIR